MDHARFWALIDAARRSSRKSSAALVPALAKLSRPEIIAFDAWFWAYYLATRREDLWAAAYAVAGGCSDDGFDYFRGWLISRGEAAVLAAINDPESLETTGEDELMLGAARVAYRKAFDAELPEAGPKLEIPGRDTWPADRLQSGVKWNRAFYAATFPKLYERHFAHLPPEPTGSITHERFWSIIDAARAGTSDVTAAVRRLDAALRELSTEDLIGFDRWLSPYNQALIRDELRAVCRILLGTTETETIAGFRGWLIMQGERAVHAATHDPETLLDHATHPVTANKDIIFITWGPLRAKDIYRGSPDDAEPIPDRDTWRADWAVPTPTVAELREHFPRLTANQTDEQLGGPFDASKVSTYDKQRIAGEILERTKSAPDTAAKLEELDQAVRMWPNNSELRTARGRVHLNLGNAAAARDDFDTALALRPEAVLVRWDRSKARLACGDRDGAIEDARESAQRVDEARAWLVAQQSPDIPTRVRHLKFGDGKVVSADLTGAEPKLVIDFDTVGRKTIAKRFVEPID